MDREPDGIAEGQAVRGAQRHVERHPLGEAHFDRHLERQVAGRQDDLTHVADGHAGRRRDGQAHADGDGQVVPKGERQRAVFGGQRVGVAGVHDADGVEQIVDRGVDRGDPLGRELVADRSGLGLAQRPKHVLAQRRGVLGAREAGARIVGERCGQTPTACR